MDTPVLIIMGLFEDPKRFMRVVALYHNGDFGSGAEEDEYSAQAIKYHPGAGFIHTAKKEDFDAVFERRYPAIHEKVKKAFASDIVIRDQNKIDNLLKIRTIDQNDLLSTFEPSIEA